MGFQCFHFFPLILAAWSLSQPIKTSAFALFHWTSPKTVEIISSRSLSSSILLRSSSSKTTQEESQQQQQQNRRRRRISLDNGRDVSLLSRSLEITSDWKITVWEWENPAEVVELYWEAQQRQNENIMLTHNNNNNNNDNKVLDPFGLVTWPGSVVAARELQKQSKITVENRTCLVLGAGVGVEAQAVAMLGASQIFATDIHPTTLKQLMLGIKENPGISSQNIVKTQILDVFDDRHILPESELIVVADVLYNEQLAKQVCTRIVQAFKQRRRRNQQQKSRSHNKIQDLKVLVTDSQRFVDFPNELNSQLESAGIYDLKVEWKEETFQFTGSGVCIDEDQTYDVKVRILWIGLN